MPDTPMTGSDRPYPFQRTVCACRLCTICCEHLPGALAPDDLPRIAAHLGYRDVATFAEECLASSEGGTVGTADGRVIRLPTLVPAAAPDGSCIFLDSGSCRIHPVSPFGCAFIDAHLSEQEFAHRTEAMNIELLRDRDLGGPYSALCATLRAAGKAAPPLEARKYRLHKALRRERLG